PAMVLEVPASQFRRDYNFVVPSTYTANFINVVGRTGASILLDGSPLPGTGTPIAGTTYSIWRLPVTPGPRRINTTGEPFGLKVFGVAQYVSYMYPGGLDLAALP